MGITAFPFSSVIDVPTARILGRDDAGTGAAEALTNTEIFAILGTGTPSASTYLRGDGTWATISAGVGGSTGSVDNAVLRADGTGGATLQASAVVIPDNFTASPNATVNHASVQATGATTNVSVSVVPKGTGSFSLQVPDGTATGGNARGANAIDLQTSRSSASQVASGAGAVTIGAFNTSSGAYSVSIGLANSSSGFASVAIGDGCTSSADVAIATGRNTSADRYGMRAHSGWRFAVNGDAQAAEFVVSNSTTTNAAVTLFLRPDLPTRLTIPSGKICQFLLIITGVRNGGADVAVYMRRVTIKNIGGTTSLVGAVDTIGTDQATGTSLAITADDANDALQIAPTGVSGQTWRWKCVVYGGEIGHG